MDLNAWQWLALAERELLLFAGIFFLLGTLDELSVDLTWLWLRLTRRAGSRPFADAIVPSARRMAVFIPAWEESDVLATTLRHMLAAWREADVQLWVGTYPNDRATAAIAAEAAYANPQIRHVVLPHDGRPPRPIASTTSITRWSQPNAASVRSITCWSMMPRTWSITVR